MTSGKPRFQGRWVKLGDVISRAHVERCGSREFPVFSMTMHDGIVRQDGRFKKKIASRDTSSYKVVNPGQLVVGFPIDEGVIYVQSLGERGIMSPAYNVWDIDFSKVDPSYLEAALHSPQSMTYYAEKMRGTTARRRTLTAENLCSMEMPLPTLDRQREVVTVLQLVKSLVSIRRSYLSKLDELVKSRFLEMFGNPVSCPKYPERLIGELADVSSGATPSRKKPEYYEGTIPWVKTGEIAAGNIDVTEEHISEEAIDNTACHILPAGTLLIAMYGQGDTRGKSALLNIEAATNQACAALEFKNEIDPRFALEHMRLCYDDLRALSHGGNQKNLSLRIIKNYSLIVPPLSLQREFADFAAQVDKSGFADKLAVRGA